MNEEKIKQICEETVKEMRGRFKSLDTRGDSEFEKMQAVTFEEMIIRNVVDKFKNVCAVYEDFKGATKIKEFKDLIFEPHAIGENGLQSKFFFENGYGVSVVRFKLTFGANSPLDPKDYYGSYTNNEDEWEVAVLEGNKESWEITEKEGDPWIEGYLTPEEVTTLMKEVQQLGGKE